jgi:hypothetical protein
MTFNSLKRLIAVTAATFLIPIGLLTAGPQAAPATAPDTTAKPKMAKAPATPPPTDAEIADAKGKGLVWVNLNSKVYHSGGDFYGKTKRGKFMSESDAKAAGFKAAQESSKKKKAATATSTTAK